MAYYEVFISLDPGLETMMIIFADLSKKTPCSSLKGKQGAHYPGKLEKVFQVFFTRRQRSAAGEN